MSPCLVVEDRTGRFGPSLRGAALRLWQCRGPEVMISGPAETGKTFASLFKLDALLWKYPGAQAVLCRKVRDTIYPTVLQTYQKKVLRPDAPVRVYGGERPAWFDYPNGARLWLAGLDDPGKALSSERDFIYVNQAEEINDDDWQVLTTRTTGRAGNAPYGQVLADCNPAHPHHWIKQRAAAGKLLLLESRHEDNPSLHDGEGWTDRGKRTLAALDALTGIRRQRLRFGLWTQAEGQVYDGWEPAVHVVERAIIGPTWARYWSVDFGYTNPFVLQWWAADPDGRLVLYRELYRTGRLVEDHARTAVALSAGEPRPRAVICDHDAEGRATFERHAQVRTVPAVKDIMAGIQAVAARLRRAGDGKPRLTVVKNATVEVDEKLVEAKKPVCTADEFDSYVWDTGNGRRKGETPVDRDNHGCFVAGTMISTPRGDVPIESVRGGDIVTTRYGDCGVIDAGITHDDAAVLTVVFSDGRTLIGTANHPVYVVGKGFIPLASLTPRDQVLTCEAKPSYLTGSNFAATPSQSNGRIGYTTSRTSTIDRPASAGCMKRFGNTITALFRLAARFITGTETRSTTTCQTWSASPPKNTPPVMPLWAALLRRNISRIWSESAPCLPNGIGQKRGENGTDSMAGECSEISRRLIASAITAGSRINANCFGKPLLDTVPASANHTRGPRLALTTRTGFAFSAAKRFASTDTKRPDAAPVFVRAIIDSGERRPVYNLTVDDAPEYYANGVLVHNCDALRYAVMHLDGGPGPRRW